MNRTTIMIFTENVRKSMIEWQRYKLPRDSIASVRGTMITLHSGLAFYFIRNAESLRGAQVDGFIMDECPSDSETLDLINHYSRYILKRIKE